MHYHNNISTFMTVDQQSSQIYDTIGKHITKHGTLKLYDKTWSSQLHSKTQYNLTMGVVHEWYNITHEKSNRLTGNFKEDFSEDE